MTTLNIISADIISIGFLLWAAFIYFGARATVPAAIIFGLAILIGLFAPLLLQIHRQLECNNQLLQRILHYYEPAEPAELKEKFQL